MSRNNLLANAVDEIDKVRWIPKNGKNRMAAMLDDRPDWCISRQRTWGVPLPLFIHKENDELHPNTVALVEKVAAVVEKHGIEAWHDVEIKKLLAGDAENYYRCDDVLDVWFDSGVIHECVLQQRPELSFPADLVLEGSDQHRGWFQTSLLTSCAINHRSPYRQVLTHGFTVDGEGRKMSKSLGNVVAPDKVIKNLGADVLRLWVASTDYHREMVVSDEVFKQAAETYRRLRNTARFLLANLDDFNPQQDLLAVENMVALDHWAVEKTAILQQQVNADYDDYQFYLALKKIHYFCSIEMGSFYLDIIKDRQYTVAKAGMARRSAQTAMFHMVEVLTRLLAPICPFTADEIWQYMPGERPGSVFLSDPYSLPQLEQSLFSESEWQKMMQVRDAVNREIERLRRDKQLGSNLEASVILYAEPNLQNLLDRFADELRFVLIVSQTQVLPLSQAATTVDTDLAELKLSISPSSDKKCARCWQHRPQLGYDQNYPDLCRRCITNINNPAGEQRRYA